MSCVVRGPGPDLSLRPCKMRWRKSPPSTAQQVRAQRQGQGEGQEAGEAQPGGETQPKSCRQFVARGTNACFVFQTAEGM